MPSSADPNANNSNKVGNGRRRPGNQNAESAATNKGGGRRQQNGLSPSGPAQPRPNRGDRKHRARAKQLDAMAKKARLEDDYFRQCQREAAADAVSQRHWQQKPRPSKTGQREREAALFGRQGAQGINFGKYDNIKVEVRPGAVEGPNEGDNDNPTFTDFAELSLPPELRRNVVERMRYQRPTPIQKHAVPRGIAGGDLMCCAQTGSGKTCAFLLPVVVSLSQSPLAAAPAEDAFDGPVEPRCVVMAPTRELASQIELEAEKLCFDMPGLRSVAVYGGADQRKQLRELAWAMGSHVIVVATPGRLTDFVERNIVSLRAVRYLVLDEADRMLDMGFEPQIRKLVLQSHMTPKDRRQTAMFSATFPDVIQKLAAAFLRPSYTWIAVGRVGSTTDSIVQVVLEATNDKRHKLHMVVEAVRTGPPGRTLIFVEKKRSATWMRKQLGKGGPEGWDLRFDPIQAAEIHGDRSQSQREAALEQFRSGACRILVATDVAARGLDIGGVEHVINADLPTSADCFDSYVHRIGRTGRAGHAGLATSFYVPGDGPGGNGKIAFQLVRQLRETKQEVPSFLEAEVAGGGGVDGGPKQKFGGRDVRSSGGGGRGRGGGSWGGGRGRGGRGRRSGRKP